MRNKFEQNKVRVLKRQRFALLAVLLLAIVLVVILEVERISNIELAKSMKKREEISKELQANILALNESAEAIRMLVQDKQENEIKDKNIAAEKGLHWEPLGEFKVTWYCACEKCCGKSPSHPGYGITATGMKVAAGRTAAADWDVLPAGSRVYIDGVGERVIEDKGGAVKGNHIDIYVESHEKALEYGRQTLNVYSLEAKK